VHCWLGSGCLLRLEERFEHQQAAQWFREFRPTVFFGVPTIYSRLADIEEETARDVGRSVKLFVSGSAPLPAVLLERFAERFGQRILERYGMTETLMTIGNPVDGERRGGSVGLPLPGVEARVVGPNDTPLPDATVGELQVRGPTVFSGYWRRSADTAAAFTTDGWFRTGDLAERASDGYFTLRGRRTDLIISGGFNVYPREVEEVLAEHPTVSEAAVVGVPDERRGELPVAFIVPAAGQTVDIDALEQHCRLLLASFKVPRRFETVERLPRNAMGKVVKGALVR
jgi:malonyl-CoA/methylmalonyl-CoA synthetase